MNDPGLYGPLVFICKIPLEHVDYFAEDLIYICVNTWLGKRGYPYNVCLIYP